jgi:two-component system OmpR family sensor kinase
MDRFRSLTARLVLTAVALVALVCLLIAGATTLAMRAYLNGRLDEEVREAVARTLTERPGPGDQPGRFTEIGSLRANFPEGQPTNGYVIAADGDDPPHREDLVDNQFAELDEVPVDGEPHDADVPGLGNYRVIASQVTFVMEAGASAPGVVVVGLPTDEVDGIIGSLIGWEALLTLLGVVAAGSAALVVVRRQLRPLREVAATAHAVSELPLASGAIALEERVPAHLTDERTEVGQVGSALNAMLDHIGSSLEARHRSEQQVRQFVADASHELRTPLTTIAGYTELARSRPDDRVAADTALAKVEEESGRMTALVEDLLLLARLDSGRPLVSKPVDLSRLLVEAVSDARVLAPDHHWRLSLPEASVDVVGDEPRLHQVVTNLLTNARKYTPAGTTVTVSAHPGGFAVHDDGPGFPPDLVDKAFERFARGDVARTRAGDGLKVGGGYGLGLSLVEAIVTAHDGRVRLRSVPGDTTVTVELQDVRGSGASGAP